MTAKDYKLVAKILSHFESPYLIAKHELMAAFIKEFAAENPRFNASKFLDACNKDYTK